MKRDAINYYNKESHMENDGTYAYYRYDGATGRYIKETLRQEDDGSYRYIQADPDTNEIIETKIAANENTNWVEVQDSMDHEWATAEERFCDNNVKDMNISMGDDSGATFDLLDTIATYTGEPIKELFEEEPTENEIIDLVRAVVNEMPESWQTLFYEHFGERKFLEQIKDEENARLGTNKSKQAFSKRKQKIINRVAKALTDVGYSCDK
jgi:hypothetical protein